MSPSRPDRRDEISSAILVVGAFTYFCLSLPAIGRRGYPPIDPIWLGVTHLWVAPIALSALFDLASSRSRHVYLVIYALVTAYVHAGAADHAVTPRHVDPVSMLFGTLVPYGPLHLVITWVVDSLMRWILQPGSNATETSAGAATSPRRALVVWFLGAAVISLTISFPFAYRSLRLNSIRTRGTIYADEQWAAGDAVKFKRFEPIFVDNVSVEYYVDPDTGLKLRHKARDLGGQDAYNARVAELIKQHGLPEWSIKEHVPEIKDVVKLFDSTDFKEITSFPHEINSSIVLRRRGGDDSLTVDTSSMNLAVGDGDPVSVRIRDPIVLIRNGSKWVGVFHKNGRLIVTASRF